MGFSQRPALRQIDGLEAGSRVVFGVDIVAQELFLGFYGDGVRGELWTEICAAHFIAISAPASDHDSAYLVVEPRAIAEILDLAAAIRANVWFGQMMLHVAIIGFHFGVLVDGDLGLCVADVAALIIAFVPIVQDPL